MSKLPKKSIGSDLSKSENGVLKSQKDVHTQRNRFVMAFKTHRHLTCRFFPTVDAHGLQDKRSSLQSMSQRRTMKRYRRNCKNVPSPRQLQLMLEACGSSCSGPGVSGPMLLNWCDNKGSSGRLGDRSSLDAIMSRYVRKTKCKRRNDACETTLSYLFDGHHQYSTLMDRNCLQQNDVSFSLDEEECPF